MIQISSPGTRPDPDELTSGLILPGRLWASAVSTVAGWVWLYCFTARKNETISTVATGTTATPAGATPTLCKMGIYQVDSGDNLTLAAATANDTTLFAAANSTYTRSLTAPIQLVAGQRYATAFLVVSAAAAPSMVGVQLGGTGFTTAAGKLPPMLMAYLPGQTDFPASISNASLSSLNAVIRFQLG